MRIRPKRAKMLAGMLAALSTSGCSLFSGAKPFYTANNGLQFQAAEPDLATAAKMLDVKTWTIRVQRPTSGKAVQIQFVIQKNGKTIRTLGGMYPGRPAASGQSDIITAVVAICPEEGNLSTAKRLIYAAGSTRAYIDNPFYGSMGYVTTSGEINREGVPKGDITTVPLLVAGFGGSVSSLPKPDDVVLAYAVQYASPGKG